MKRALVVLSAAIAVAGCHVTVVPAPVVIRPRADTTHADAGRHHEGPLVIVMAPDPRHEHARDSAEAARDRGRTDRGPGWAERPHEGDRSDSPSGLADHDRASRGQSDKDHDRDKAEHGSRDHAGEPDVGRDASDHADHGHGDAGQGEHGNQSAKGRDNGNSGQGRQAADQGGRGNQGGQGEHGNQSAKGRDNGNSGQGRQAADRGGQGNQGGQGEHGNQSAKGRDNGNSGQGRQAADQGGQGNQGGQGERTTLAAKTGTRRTEQPARSAPTPQIVTATIPQLLTSDAFVGKDVRVTGMCLAEKDQRAVGETPVTSSGWQLAVGGAAIWVTGMRPRGCTPAAGSRQPVTIVAKVVQGSLSSHGTSARETRRYLDPMIR